MGDTYAPRADALRSVLFVRSPCVSTLAVGSTRAPSPLLPPSSCLRFLLAFSSRPSVAWPLRAPCSSAPRVRSPQAPGNPLALLRSRLLLGRSPLGGLCPLPRRGALRDDVPASCWASGPAHQSARLLPAQLLPLSCVPFSATLAQTQ